jgi:ACS family tartrate transporter-like MFS transporter
MAGYLLFEAPSNVILARVGARLWIFRIMASWGIVAASCALIQGPLTLYSLRFLLGIAEAGFYPGMLLYLTYWFPQDYRARLQAMFIAGAPLASVIGAPLSSLVLGMDGVLGLHGWQWVFVLEGFPAFLLAFAVLKLLPDGCAAAGWLSQNEKEIIAARLAAEKRPQQHGVWQALHEPRAIALGCVLFAIGFARLSLALWLPLIAQNAGLGRLGVGLGVAVPYFVAVCAMVLWGLSSDRRNERFAHISIPIIMAAAALMLASLTYSVAGLLIALSCAIICIEAFQGPFWCLPSLYLGGRAAAAGIGLVAAMGNFGGFIGTSMMGVLRQSTGAYSSGFVVLAGVLTASLLAVLFVARDAQPRAAILPDELPDGR